MREGPLNEARRLLAMIQDDCKADAANLDSTPFTPAGLGPVFGNTLAMIDSLALIVDGLVLAIESIATEMVAQAEESHQ